MPLHLHPGDLVPPLSSIANAVTSDQIQFGDAPFLVAITVYLSLGPGRAYRVGQSVSLACRKDWLHALRALQEKDEVIDVVTDRAEAERTRTAARDEAEHSLPGQQQRLE